MSCEIEDIFWRKAGFLVSPWRGEGDEMRGQKRRNLCRLWEREGGTVFPDSLAV